MLPYRSRPKPRSAGGLTVCKTSPQFRPIKRRVSVKWRQAVKKFLLTQSKHDPRITAMVADATAEWSIYPMYEYHQWVNLTPREKQQALFSWLLTQPTPKANPSKAIDLLAAGLSGLLYWDHHVQPRHDEYSRAVDCARPVWLLLRKVYRTYTRDNGQGEVKTERVMVNRQVVLWSRHACQRIEAEIKKQAGWILEVYRAELIETLTKVGLIGV